MTGSTDLPAPLVPFETDISGLPAFMLDVERLFASELWALSTGEEFKAALALWGRAWQQTPPGSVPNDDRLLAAFSGAGTRWKKVRAMALRGFVLCSDNRYYHRVLCADVMRAAKNKEDRRLRTLAASKARRNKGGEDPTPPSGGEKPNENNKTTDRYDARHDHRNDPRNGVRHERRDEIVTQTVTSSHRQDRTGQDSKKDNRPGPAGDPVPPAEPARGENWATRANFDRVEQRVRAEMPGGGPQDLRIGPIARLEADGLDLEAEIIPNLLDIAAASRTPIRTWAIYADRVAERVALQRLTRAQQGLAATPAAPVPASSMVDLGTPYGAWAEDVLRLWVSKSHAGTAAWPEHQLGPAPGQHGCRIPSRLMLEAA